MWKRLAIAAGLIIPVALWASNLPISSLPLGTGSSVGTNDSFPYTNVTAGQPYRLKLDDLVNLPAFQSEFNLLAPIASPTFTGTVTIPALNLVGSSTSGYVWTATDTTGDGSWQAATGGVTAVTATAPLASSGGTTPVISLPSPLPVGNGGLGINTTPSNGYLPIGNGTDYTAAALTAGSGVSITNGTGSVSIAETYPMPSPSPSGNFLESNGTAYVLANPNPYPLPSPSPSGLYVQSTGTGYTLAAAANPLPSPSPSGDVLTANGSSWVAAAPYVQAQNQGGGSVHNATLIQAPNFQVTNTSGSTYLIETGNANLASNASFENGTVATSWSTGSGVTASAYTSAPVDGAQAIQLSLSSTSSSELLLYDTVTYLSNATWPVGANAEASIWVNTTVSGLEVCPVEAGSALTAQCVAIPSSGTWAKVSTNFVFPNTGISVGIGIYGPSSVSSGTVYADKAYVGIATNLAQVSQTQSLGTATWVSGTNSWSISSATTSYGSFPANASMPSPSFSSGSVLTAPGTKIPAVVIPSAGPGTYVVTGIGAFYNNSGKIAYWAMSDGTNTGTDNVFYASGATANTSNVVAGVFTYTTPQTNLTFQPVGKSFSSGANLLIGLGESSSDTFSISVTYYPSQSQTGYRADQTPASWSGTSTLSGTTSSTSIADLGSVSGSVTTTASRNITCSAASGLVGITCALPRTGNYFACYFGQSDNNVTQENTLTELTDGSNNVIVGLQAISTGYAGAYSPIGGCGVYSASSGSVTFKVMGYVTDHTGTVDVTSFSVVELDAPMPAPYLQGSNTTTNAGGVHTEALSFTCSSSSSIGSQSPGTAWSIGNISSSGCTFTIPSGEFSAAPYACTANVTGSSAQSTVLTTELTSSTSVTVFGSGSPSSFTGNMICVGLR